MSPFTLVVVAALLDIGANFCATRSDGFARRSWAVATLLLIFSAFTLLAQAVQGMDLAVAYASWGAMGIIGTAVVGRLLLGQKLKPVGWCGIALMTASVLLMKLG
ncbi:SMR family transporter [Ferrimonas sp. YFM]|uniref:SMR family transporter n=1 Tax=Ferrimonas sp. YFM TaxID=3028878 RepID=UPI0025747037|nr:SMR family transporter [Ferrimonas sp. YFM]BDY03483.1 multidrug transporter [Ferrimonas sp. YFM]